MAAQVARVVAEGYRSLCRALLIGLSVPSSLAAQPVTIPAARREGVDPYLLWRLAGQAREIMICLFYGADGLFLAEYVCHGTAVTVAADRAALMRRAVELRARYVVLAHNHPNGEARPSVQDIETTRQIYRLFETLGTRLVDHAIVTRTGTCFSFRQKGLI